MNSDSFFRKVKTYPIVDISFEDINYSVYDRWHGSGFKKVLHSVNGEFLSGNLIAMLGSSGAGKTTLLNVLAGYVINDVTGKIKINGSPRTMKTFSKMSAYIMQNDLVQPLLTVDESMMVAANLKLSKEITQKEKKRVVNEVLSMLGLTTCSRTRCENISGGQRKRLSIGLELVNNPPVIFLDEPITGLDTFAGNQCICMLKELANQGRTIICTIHQPTDFVFKLFDQVYFMAEGKCVYSGSVDNLIPYLSVEGFYCPMTYSPADYIIEITQGNANVINVLAENAIKSKPVCSKFDEPRLKNVDDKLHEEDFQTFATSFWTQFIILSHRKWLQMKRNKMPIFIQLFHHIFSAVLIGLIFLGVGNKASMIFNNFKFLLCCMVFFVYTYAMVPILTFPTEIALLKREHFNSWYSLNAYYISMTLIHLPVVSVMGSITIIITYIMTDQPLIGHRFILFLIANILNGISSHGVGLAIASVLNAKNGAYMGPAIVSPLAVLCIYGMGYGEYMHPVMKILIQFSYMRYSLVAMCNALYDDRGILPCTDEIYCPYSDPKLLMRQLGMDKSSYVVQIIGMITFTCLHRYIAYILLSCRLKSNYLQKLYQKFTTFMHYLR